MKRVSKRIATASEEVSSESFDRIGTQGLETNYEFYRLLYARTEGEARQVVLVTGGDNG